MTQESPHIPAPQLRTGYTTGACSAAAAKGAALMLAHQTTVREVSISLPAGESATFRLYGQRYAPDTASCFVIKDAGDDPDITNGAEVHAEVQRVHDPLSGSGNHIRIEGGRGVGRITKPGLAVPPGEWAINPVPRRMITEAVSSVTSPFTPHHSPFTLTVTISIPDGEERAKKTLNARLGIIGGLSILGTTGIVRPISAKAWTDTIDASLDVAKACGCGTVVLSTGRTSELAAQKMFNVPQKQFKVQSSIFDVKPETVNLEPQTSNMEPLPVEAFIMMGDHIAYAVRACQARGFHQPLIACQFAKMLKIACGHENTHAAASELDLQKLLAWGQDGDLPDATMATISHANTAREIAIASSFDPQLLELVFQHARSAVRKHSPEISIQFLVADYGGTCIFDSR